MRKNKYCENTFLSKSTEAIYRKNENSAHKYFILFDTVGFVFIIYLLLACSYISWVDESKKYGKSWAKVYQYLHMKV